MAGEPPSNTKKSGIVKWFNSAKGFGFITSDEEGEDLFVHQTSVKAQGFRSLLQGEIVEFIVEVGEDGRKRALNVTGPKGAAVQGASRRGGYGGRGGGGGYGGRGTGGGAPDMSGGGGGGGTVAGFNGTCYNCGQPGHMSRECTQRQSGRGGGGRGGGRGVMGIGRVGASGRGVMGIGRVGAPGRGGRGAGISTANFACYHCGEAGHLQRECPHG